MDYILKLLTQSKLSKKLKMALTFQLVKRFLRKDLHTAPQLRCGTDISTTASHCSITAFQVKMNLTFMRHRNVVTSHECVERQRNAIAV